MIARMANPNPPNKFKKGHSGNPNGRPKGTGPRQFFHTLMKDKKQILLKKAIEMAEDGNEAMIKFICERLIPPRVKDEPIEDLDLSGTIAEKSEKILKALQDGKIDPTQAQVLMDIISKHKENVDSAGYEVIVNLLKSKGMWTE